MKTAEEWYDEKEMCGDEDADGNLLPYEFTPDDFRAIQLDAMKEGMRRAETLVQKEHNSFANRDCNHGFKTARDKMSKSILFAAEQLTEKDL